MSGIERKTFSLPRELMQALDEEVMLSGRSVNAIVVARLQGSMADHRQSEQLQSENQKLRTEVEELKAELADRPPPGLLISTEM
jgi:cell shape-determining protein MreC